jgi:hypothetical protein
MMTADLNASPVSRKLLWAAYAMGALPVLLLLMSSILKLVNPPFVTEGFVHLGYPGSQALGIGIAELISTILYVIPRTSVLGAILLTGYLGGATASHVRIGEPFHAAILLGVLIWASLYVRDASLRALLPLRS